MRNLKISIYAYFALVHILCVQCNTPKHDSKNNNNEYDGIEFAFVNENDTIGIYYPEIIGDSFLYVGKTHYTKIPDGFDTLYTDTIKVYRFHDRAFIYRVNELKYKWLAPLPGETLDDIMISRIRDSFQLNNKHIYELQGSENELKGRVTMIFRSIDSLYFQNYEEDTKDKIEERHTFRGKAIVR